MQKQLSNQAQASSADGENSLPAEPTWSAHQPRRHNITPPLLVRAPMTPPRQFSTPPPPASSFEYYTPQIESRMRSSLPLNPWNPFLRSYGRVYPYNVGVNDQSAPHNYVVMRENSSPERPSANYTTRIHLVAQPPTPPPAPQPAPPQQQPPPLSQHQYCEYAPVHNPLPMGESMRRTLARPRSNHSRSFHHYRHGVQDTEASSGYSSLPVELIEISSSDEEDDRGNARRSTTPSYLRRHSEHVRPTCNRNGSHNAVVFARSPVHRVRVKYVPNIHPTHMRTTSSEENISTSGNHYRTERADNEPLINRMKRPHRFSPHSPSKLYRRSHGCCRSDSSSYRPENTSPYNSDEFGNGRSRPRLCLNDSNVNPTTVASTSQSFSNRMSNNNSSNDNAENDIHHHNHNHHSRHRNNDDTLTTCNNNNNNSDNSGNSSSNIEQKEQKFKIRIKREFKIEPNDNSKNNENVESESVVVDTKAHLQPLIANIKQEE